MAERDGDFSGRRCVSGMVDPELVEAFAENDAVLCGEAVGFGAPALFEAEGDFDLKVAGKVVHRA